MGDSAFCSGARCLSIRLSVTERCQLRCFYCKSSDAQDGAPEMGEISVAEAAVFVRALRRGFGLRSVRITGGEPLLREDIADLVKALAAEGASDLAMTTNGQLLASAAAPLKKAGLRRVNVSLDSLDEKVFRMVTRGGELRRTIDGIDAALRHLFSPIKLNCVVLRGINDEEAPDLLRFGLERRCHVRFLELMPIGPARRCCGRLFVSSDEVMRRLGRDFELRPLDREDGATSRNFLARDRRGRSGVVGFISPQTHPFCGDCRRIRLTSSGRLIGCLAGDRMFDIRDMLKKGEEGEKAILAVVSAALSLKPRCDGYRTPLPMVRIGG
jgi:cyclic pyranopterin phosphate synthase